LKKLALIFLVFAYVFSFYVAYVITDYEEIEKIKNLEKSIGTEFSIPNSLQLADPEEMYAILCDAAKEANVNIIRTSINYKENDEVEIIKYILLTTQTQYFNYYNLKGGRVLTNQDTQQSEYFLSTVSINDTNQIGEIKEFAHNDLITIKPLILSYESFPVYGTYYVEGDTYKVRDKFLDIFIQKINIYYEKYGSNFTQEDFLKNLGKKEAQEVRFSGINILKYQSYMVYIIVVILLAYYILNDSKRIGILKMHGISNVRMWYIMVGKLITLVFVFSVTASLVISLFLETKNSMFIYNVFMYQLKAYIILIVASIISFLYILRIKIISIIKKFKDTNSIFVLNLFIKIVCSVVIIMTGVSAIGQYNDIQNKMRDLKNWEQSKDYGIIFPVYVGYDNDDMFISESIYDSTVHNELYFLLNQNGSILINTKMYEEKNLLVNQNWNGIRSIKVNPNYLNKFPVYDINGELIQISEDTTNWILLVPEKYRNRETDILNFFANSRKNKMKNDQDYYNKAIQESIANQEIRVIWLKNEQKIFSFNPEVFPSEGNIILDPIIEVVTERNSLLTDRDTILGGGSTDPLKIKLLNRDPLKTYNMLEPELKRLKLEDNFKHLITIDQQIMKEIYQYQSFVRESLLAILGLMIGLIVLIVQNLIIVFNKNQHRFIVRRLFGVGFFRTYKEYIGMFLAIWMLQILIAFFINKEITLELLLVSTFCMGIELIASVIVLISIEQTKKIQVLKTGG